MKKIDFKQLNRSELKNVFGGKLAPDSGESVPVFQGSYACCSAPDPRTGVRQCSTVVYVPTYDVLECVDPGTSVTNVG
ncbi:hypothetical protein CMU68_10495 [Elizabethkingia anophelis]|nr:hypothetical protein [Elizabethkingia anophelis]MDV3678790.1 hypothetical protein [Elizabethkingia anophelis]